MRKLIFLSGVFLFSLFTIVHDGLTESDILGWGKVIWGMTHSQVSKIYTIGEWAEEYPNCGLKEKITIQSETFSVVFRFEKKSPSGKLVGISLPFGAEDVHITHYDKICDAITSKYGPPSYPEKKERIGVDGGTIKRTITWVRKSATIDFSSMYYWNLEKKKFILFGGIIYTANLDKDKL